MTNPSNAGITHGLIFPRPVTYDVAVQRERLDQAARVVGGALRRLMTLEQRLYPGNVISQEQATELKAKVHAVARELIWHGWSSSRSSGPFQSLFGELNRRFAVPSYQAISIEQFGRAMTWLGEIQAALEAGRPPDLQP